VQIPVRQILAWVKIVATTKFVHTQYYQSLASAKNQASTKIQVDSILTNFNFNHKIYLELKKSAQSYISKFQAFALINGYPSI